MLGRPIATRLARAEANRVGVVVEAPFARPVTVGEGASVHLSDVPDCRPEKSVRRRAGSEKTCSALADMRKMAGERRRMRERTGWSGA